MTERRSDDNLHSDHTPYLLLVSVGNTRVRSALASVSPGAASVAGIATLQHGGSLGGGRAGSGNIGEGQAVGGMGGAGGSGGEILRWSAVRNDEASAEALLRPASEYFGWAAVNQASATGDEGDDDDDRRAVHVVLASVNPQLADRLASELLRHPRVSGLSRTFNAWAGSLGKAASSGGRAVARSSSASPSSATPSGGAAKSESGGVAIQLHHLLDNASTLGQDRALNAVAAHAICKSACIVIDAGTAITVDFIDGQGTFCGGCILPGVQLMADALHEHTAALPKITPDIKHGFAVQSPATSTSTTLTPVKKNPRTPIDPYADEDDTGAIDDGYIGRDGVRIGVAGRSAGRERHDDADDDRRLPDDPPPLAAPLPFGRDTSSAMTAGIAAAAVGAVHLLINRYAEYYEAYPRIIATGGDAPRLFETDELVEHIVPDLTLRGVLECVKQALHDEDDDEHSDDNDSDHDDDGDN